MGFQLVLTTLQTRVCLEYAQSHRSLYFDMNGGIAKIKQHDVMYFLAVLNEVKQLQRHLAPETLAAILEHACNALLAGRYAFAAQFESKGDMLIAQLFASEHAIPFFTYYYQHPAAAAKMVASIPAKWTVIFDEIQATFHMFPKTITSRSDSRVTHPLAVQLVYCSRPLHRDPRDCPMFVVCGTAVDGAAFDAFSSSIMVPTDAADLPRPRSFPGAVYLGSSKDDVVGTGCSV